MNGTTPPPPLPPIRIPKGVYKWTWDVLLPEAMPPRNVWFLSFCSDPTCGLNGRPEEDPKTLVTFSLPGFRMGERMGDHAGFVSRNQKPYMPDPADLLAQKEAEAAALEASEAKPMRCLASSGPFLLALTALLLAGGAAAANPPDRAVRLAA